MSDIILKIALIITIYGIFIFSIIFFTSWSLNKINPISHYKIRRKLIKNVKKILKPNWYIINVSKINIEKLSNDEYKIFVKLDKHNSRLWTCSDVIVDKDGRILKEDFKMELFDNFEKDTYKGEKK